jgi:hypothetical protein
MPREFAEVLVPFNADVPTGSVLGFTALAGQIGIAIQRVAGGSLEIGGASLAAGSGFLMSNTNLSMQNLYPMSGTLYAISTGSTATVTGFRLISQSNPDNLG